MESDATNSRGRQPPLPPRQDNNGRSLDDAPPPYELVAHQQKAYEKAASNAASRSAPGLSRNDPRSSSQDSLAPKPGEQEQRRRLLLVYIHGFMGNETSFQSFPAHVHNLLAVLLGETHVVHTKIYPRYRSKGHISNARNDFSRWLEPHESVSTDVVLLGHSMGGLLSAEVALMPPSPLSRPLKHRLLGTINFDVPFLGMHPGVVKSGLASIFKPSDDTPDEKRDSLQGHQSDDGPNSNEPAGQTPSRMDTLWGKADPNYNPKFANDVALPVRKGWRNAWHFVNKHSNDLVKSTQKLVSSHMEFGGAMANYNELKTRYARIRALQEEDSRVRQTVVEGGVPDRVRFVNYYTASTGRLKKAESPLRRLSPSPNRSGASSRASASRTSSINEQWEDSMENLKIADSTSQPLVNERRLSSNVRGTVPELPRRPPPLGDLDYIQDQNIRKMVEYEHARAVDAYEKVVREHEQLKLQNQDNEDGQKFTDVAPPHIGKGKERERRKPESEMTHSEREELRLENERNRMAAESRRLRGEPEPQMKPKLESVQSQQSVELPRIESRTPSMPASTVGSGSAYDSNLLTPQQSTETTASSQAKPKKDRKFCNLPPKDKNGDLDPCWVRVFMENVDEVGAHCGLFFVDERYERLVGDVGERIEQWVLEANSVRVMRHLSPAPGEKR